MASHRINQARFADQQRMQEMVCAAMEESWDAILGHIERYDALIGQVVAEGVSSGEFRAIDPQQADPVHPYGDDPLPASAADGAVRAHPRPQRRGDDRLHHGRAGAAQGRPLRVPARRGQPPRVDKPPREQDTPPVMASLSKQSFKKLAVIVHDLVATAVAIWLVFVVRFEGPLLDEHLRYLPRFLPFFVVYGGAGLLGLLALPLEMALRFAAGPVEYRQGDDDPDADAGRRGLCPRLADLLWGLLFRQDQHRAVLAVSDRSARRPPVGLSLFQVLPAPATRRRAKPPIPLCCSGAASRSRW